MLASPACWLRQQSEIVILIEELKTLLVKSAEVKDVVVKDVEVKRSRSSVCVLPEQTRAALKPPRFVFGQCVFIRVL